jgi:hypothetical protein
MISKPHQSTRCITRYVPIPFPEPAVKQNIDVGKKEKTHHRTNICVLYLRFGCDHQRKKARLQLFHLLFCLKDAAVGMWALPMSSDNKAKWRLLPCRIWAKASTYVG